jgi:hypothetical protein
MRKMLNPWKTDEYRRRFFQGPIFGRIVLWIARPNPEKARGMKHG